MQNKEFRPDLGICTFYKVGQSWSNHALLLQVPSLVDERKSSYDQRSQITMHVPFVKQTGKCSDLMWFHSEYPFLRDKGYDRSQGSQMAAKQQNKPQEQRQQVSNCFQSYPISAKCNKTTSV